MFYDCKKKLHSIKMKIVFFKEFNFIYFFKTLAQNYFFLNFICLFIETHRKREAEIQAEGEAGSM